MSRFLVGVATLTTNPHAACFLDFATAMAGALRALGHEVEHDLHADPKVRPRRLVVFGMNNVRDDANAPKIPDDAIIYNAEQVSAVAVPQFFLPSYVRARRLCVWDYAKSNIDEMKKPSVGITRAVHCPVGYFPSMTKIRPVPDEDIDVLFYGALNARRKEMIRELEAVGIRVARLFGVYGDERDRIIARAKIVLNLHVYPRGVFEIFRCSHLFANRKCVVTEDGGRDPELEQLARATCAYAPRERLADECRRLLADVAARREQAERGYEEFKKTDLVENVRRALEGSGS